VCVPWGMAGAARDVEETFYSVEVLDLRLAVLGSIQNAF
jgi:hypothetical protein